MSHYNLPFRSPLPAPCIVDSGLLVNKRDMQRILSDLGRVVYRHEQDGTVLSEGEGYVIEVFSDPTQATIVTNQTLYLNVQSFDYLELGRTDDNQALFRLGQDHWSLYLMPQSDPMQDQVNRSINSATLEAVVAEVLSANWDVCIDDDNFSL